MPRNLIPEGFRDDVSEQVLTEHKFTNEFIEHFQCHGYELVKTPLIEFYDKSFGDNSFNIKVKKNEKRLILRDDITLQIARLSFARLSKKKRPLKLCYYGEVVRKQGSMLRPERQFLQIGAECIGEKNNLADVEMMDLAYSSLKLVGIKNIFIEISSRIFLDKFYSSIKNSQRLNNIKTLIKQKDLSGLLKLVEKKNHQYLRNIFSCTGLYKDKVGNLEKLKIDKNTSQEIQNIKDIVSSFCINNKGAKVFLDLCEIDDKNYHKGIRFTFFSNNIRGEIAKGGRYFSKNLDQEEESTGFTCYMDTILRASSFKQINKKIMIEFKLSKTKKKQLIEKGYVIVTHFGEAKNIKKKAKEHNCQFYLNNNNIKSL